MHRFMVVIAIAGCGSPKPADEADASVDAAVAPVFRNPVSLADAELATAALKILGGDVPNADQQCNGCHGLTRQKLRYWRALSDSALTNCLTDLSVATSESAQQMIDCTRAMPDLATSDFQTTKLGVYATATKLPWFQF